MKRFRVSSMILAILFVAGCCAGCVNQNDPGDVTSLPTTETAVITDKSGNTVAEENELDDICLLSNKFEADLFVSIHCDAVESKSPNGTTTFVCKGCSNTSRKLAYAIQNQIVNSMGTYDRGVREASYYVTRYTDCPAVLVEVGFLSNPSEEDLINQKYEEFAHAISRGITDSLQ